MTHLIITVLCTVFSVQCAEKILIRPAEPRDIDHLNALSIKQYQNDFKPLWEKFYKPLFPSIDPEQFVKEKTELNNQKNTSIILDNNTDKSLRLLVAEIQDVESLKPKIAGFCRFEKLNETTMYGHFVIVDEDFRKQGIAKRLAFAAMNTFPDVITCKFRAQLHNKDINEIYLKHGCTQKGQVSICLETGKINTDPNAVITHYEYEYIIKK